MIYNISMIKKIITIPDPILHQKAKEVPVSGSGLDKKTSDLIKDLRETLRVQVNPRGIGISAPQIGVSKRVLLMKQGNKVLTIINPKILHTSKETLSRVLDKKNHFMEGCLSVPGYWAIVNRPYKIKVEFYDLSAIKTEMEFENKEASLFLHEFDHLDGILFIDRALEQGNKIYKLETNDKGEEDFVEIELI